MNKAKYYRKIEDGYLCELCPQRCHIVKGGHGVCGVRVGTESGLFAENYGLVSSIAYDPIEKKPLSRFFPGSHILSIGSYGCNMRCAFCQNSSISQEVPETEYDSPERIVEIAASIDGNLGVAFTYNEPLIGIEFLLDTAPLLKERGLKVVLVTNGQINQEPFLDLLPYVDAMNIDLKGFTPEFYHELGGEIESTKKTIEISSKYCHVEVTTLIVPGKNDKEEEIQKLSSWLSKVSPKIPYHITRFFPHYHMADSGATPIATLERLADVARRNLKDVFIGNV